MDSQELTVNNVYIDKANRHDLVRQFVHLGLSIFTNKALSYGDKDATAIRKHCQHQDHVNCIGDFKIIGNYEELFFAIARIIIGFKSQTIVKRC